MLLNDVQVRFRDVMLDHPDVAANPPSDLEAVFESGDIALSERLKIYRNNIVGSVTDMMVATFPTLEKLVGTAFLEGMARSFILAHPPSHGCLNLYGAGFSEFIEGFAPAAALPYLPDIARLELAMNDSYYAADDLALDGQGLAAIAPEALGDTVLRFRHSVKLLQLAYPVTAIRDFAFSDQSGDAPDIDAGGETLMVHRPFLDTQIVILSAAEHFMLRQLADENPLGAAVEATLTLHDRFDFQEFLQKFLALETFVAFDTNGPP